MAKAMDTFPRKSVFILQILCTNLVRGFMDPLGLLWTPSLEPLFSTRFTITSSLASFQLSTVDSKLRLPGGDRSKRGSPQSQ